MSAPPMQSNKAIWIISGPMGEGEMAAKFEMKVREKIILPGIPDVIVAGPVLRGDCRKGDFLVLRGSRPDQQVTCNGIELLNWGMDRTDWISIRLSDVELEDLAEVTNVLRCS